MLSLRRRPFTAALLVVGTLGITWLGVEILLHTVEPLRPRFMKDLETRERIHLKAQAFDPDLGAARRLPNQSWTVHQDLDGLTVTYDMVDLGLGDIGFRDDGVDGRPFGVCLGDSFTEGAGVKLEETWTERLERLSGRDFANLGVSGTGLVYASRLYRTYARRLKPEWVVYAFFPNDFREDAHHLRIEKELAARCGRDADCALRRLIHREDWSGSPLYLVRRHSLLFRFWNTVVRGRAPDEDGGFIPLEKHPELGVILEGMDPIDPGGFDPWAAAFRALSEDVGRDGGRLAMMLIPSREMVYESHIRNPEIRAAARLELEISAQAEAIARDAGVPTLNLLPVLRAAVAGGATPYFFHDSHWNPTGHRLAAESLTRQVFK